MAIIAYTSCPVGAADDDGLIAERMSVFGGTADNLKSRRESLHPTDMNRREQEPEKYPT